MANVTVTNPANGDVRVIPDALLKQYEARGFEQVKASESKPEGSGSKARK